MPDESDLDLEAASERSMRIWRLATITSAIVIIAISVPAGIMGGAVPGELISLILTTLSSVAAYALYSVLASSNKRIRAVEKNQGKKLVDAEARAAKAVEYPEYFADQLGVLAERSRLVMTRAGGRADWCNAVGTVLAMLSVCAPAGAFLFYYLTEPFGIATPQQVMEWVKDYGRMPEGVDVNAEKDWHILLAGISFGFLFLAAASSLFAQQRRHVEMYHTISGDVKYLDGLQSAIQIQRRADAAVLSVGMAQLTDRIISELLRRRPANGERGTDTSEVKPAKIIEESQDISRHEGAIADLAKKLIDRREV